MKGFYLNVSGEAPNCVMKKFREMVEARAESDAGSEGAMKFLTSILMKNAFFSLKLKSPAMVKKFYEKLGIKDILLECPTLSDIL